MKKNIFIALLFIGGLIGSIIGVLFAGILSDKFKILLIANDRFKGMEVVKGKITLPDLPGIGVVKL